ncbi:MAG: protein kinase domain-containing protein [Gemmatimonadaceae bacterium]
MSDQLASLTSALADRYTIERELGQGGMATVYLAHDARHDRKVAVKVLRPELAAVIGAERFLSEIKTTANLQHPHILPLHDSGSANGFLFYVMPYVEGESLRDRLVREHQLPVPEALRLATEAASALDYAHRRGVVHRDIKPENILLHDGGALVADFGIALAVSTAGSRMTETGMSLGTPHYMSPEQAMGEREITPRSDVYALGCVTYEMLVGEPPFTGPTAQAIVARVMTEDPRGLSVQRKSIPPHVEAAVHTALSKMPADRFATAAEFAAALNDPSRTVSLHAATPAARRARWKEAGIVAAIALVLGAMAGTLFWPPTPVPGDVVRVLMSLPDSGGVRPIDNLSLAVSPDGRRIAYVGPARNGRMLWVREMNDFEGRPLPGTEGALAPFFSPGGDFIGFFAGGSGDTQLKVTPAAGGTVRTLLTDSVARWGGAWGRDGNIYFTSAVGASGGIGRVPADGGNIVAVSRPDTANGVQEHDYIALLPSGKGAIVQFWKGSPGQNEIGVIDLKSGEATSLLKGTFARFLPPDRLIYGTSDGRVFAVRFDERSLTTVGDAVQVLDNVQLDASNGALQFDVSRSGTVVYVPGSTVSREVVWVSRDGTVSSIDTTWVGAFKTLALSPDGGRLAITVGGNDGDALWVKRLPSGPVTRLTFVGGSDRPVWTADGASVAYLGNRNARRSVWTRRADGSNEEQLIAQNLPQLDEVTLSMDGQWMVLRSLGGAANSRKLSVMRVGVDSTPRPLMRTDYDNFSAVISPDGRWLAYVSNESKRYEVYVRPFPSVDSARWTVSVNGGMEPVWSRSGRELFYRTSRDEMMSIPIAPGDAFAAGAPVRLFTNPAFLEDEFHRQYDVSPDDQRFVMVRDSEKNIQTLGVIINWAGELDRLLKRK